MPAIYVQYENMVGCFMFGYSSGSFPILTKTAIIFYRRSIRCGKVVLKWISGPLNGRDFRTAMAPRRSTSSCPCLPSSSVPPHCSKFPVRMLLILGSSC